MAEVTKDLVSVIIVNYNSGLFLAKAVDSALRQDLVRTEVIVVDNASSDESLGSLNESAERLKVIRNDSNQGFACACNIGYQHANGKFILFLNPDSVLHDDAVAELVRVITKHKDAAICGPLLLGEDGEEQAGGRRDIPSPWKVFCVLMSLDKLMPSHPRFKSFNYAGKALPKQPCTVDAVSGACMLVQRRDIESSGLFDEEYFLHFEDLELCMRMGRAGKTVWFVPGAVCVHAKGICSAERPLFVAYHKHVSFVKFINQGFLNYYPKSFLIVVSMLVYTHLLIDAVGIVILKRKWDVLTNFWRRLGI